MTEIDVNSVEIETLCTYIDKHITRSDFAQTWNILLNGFLDTNASHKKRYKMIKYVLIKLKEKESTLESELMKILGNELAKLKTKHLVELVDFCIESIQSFEVSQSYCWRELLPALLNILTSRVVEDMKGEEYKKKVITNLCAVKWAPNIITSIAAMFKETPVSKEEHAQIVNKLCQSMEALTPQEIPAFTYQLLQLCKHQNGKSLILRLNNYFGKRLYQNVYKTVQSSEETVDSMDLIEDYSKYEAQQAESTVLYHIYEAATLGNASIREYLNSLKVISKSPEYILHPFQLVILLAISNVHEDVVVDLIKYSITKSILEQQKRLDSAWFSQMVPTKIEVDAVFQLVLDSNLKEKGIVVHGLINLAFALLTTSPALGRDAIAEKHHQLSQKIILKLLKKRPDVAPNIFRELEDKILTESVISQYTECLYQICRNAPGLALENQSILVQLIEKMVQLTSTSSIMVVRSVLPLMKISYNIRDSLVLVLRKALYARDTSTRQMAVIGFLQLLENFKICNLVALSQSQCSSMGSGRSILSQISVENQSSQSIHSNEVLCLEILNVLRRCFLLGADIKSQLYDGLYNAICYNTELQIHGLEQLYGHFKKFYEKDESVPLNLRDCIAMKDGEPILQEPLGKYIFILGLIVVKLENVDEIKEIFTDLVEKMSFIKLADFGMDGDLPESSADNLTKQLQLQQILLIYEALIGYQVLLWKSDDPKDTKLLDLFKAYSKFHSSIKSLTKKKDSKRKVKFDQHVLNLQVLEKMLSILYLESTQFSTELHNFAITSLLEILPSVKVSKMECVHNIHYLQKCLKIGCILYQKCVKNYSTFAEFNQNIALSALEAFHAILTIIVTYYKPKLSQFLKEIQEDPSTEQTLSEYICPVLDVMESIFEEIESDEKETGLICLKTIDLLLQNLPASSVYTAQVLDWSKKLTVTPNKATMQFFLNLQFQLQLRCNVAIHARGTNSCYFHAIALQICKLCGSINHEDVDVPMELPLITEASVPLALQALGKILQSELENVDWIIARLKADFSMIKFPIDDSLERKREKLKSTEYELVSRVWHITEIAITISNIAVPPGVLTDHILKLLTNLYNILGSLTKYFILRSSKDAPTFQNARFDRIVQLVNSLSSNAYALILYIGDTEHDEVPETKKRKKDVIKNKVLRETKCIPKLVYEMELFGKLVIQLGNKTKTDLKTYVKQGASRDYRIKAPDLKTALEQKEHSDEEEGDTTNISCSPDSD